MEKPTVLEVQTSVRQARYTPRWIQYAAAGVQVTEKHNSNSRIIFGVVYVALRYYAAFTLFTYGFAKLMGAQFTVLDSQLAKPMGDVSGFWLTWYYFGYSPLYSAVIACAQIAGALLLCFRRTAIAGAFILIPIMVNIVCVDIWIIQFPFGSEALRNAIYALLALLAISAFHLGDIYRFLIRRRDDLAFFRGRRWWLMAIQVAVVVGMVTYTAHKGYWLANVNNRAPTPIDGAWHVSRTQPDVQGFPDWMYFEYNRAFMAVFHYPGGTSETHDFRVDSQGHKLTISQQWLRPGADTFNGIWARNGDTLTLKGSWHNLEQLTVTLERKQMPVKDHQ